MDIQKQRELLQELLISGKLDSLNVQVIALNLFANSIGYKAVNGNIRKGFVGYDHDTWNVTHNISLEDMQSCYNRGFRTLRTSIHKIVGDKVVERISLQYNKKIGKLTSELYWLKFVKED
ncbi:hypothetical protein vBAcePPAc_0020 [Aeromonas phage vB_AceP_PAc]|nr:hypothetical protein vBAcePPAc_0020 [Aeromonas phage vB_AceP_PAc]